MTIPDKDLSTSLTRNTKPEAKFFLLVYFSFTSTTLHRPFISYQVSIFVYFVLFFTHPSPLS